MKFLYLLGFYYICFFPPRVLNLFLRFLVFNLFSGIREGVALSINGYIIIICFHTFVIFLNLFLFKCIVSLLTKYFYCLSFYTWASGSDNRGNPYPTYWSKWIDWLIDWLIDIVTSVSGRPDRKSLWFQVRFYILTNIKHTYDKSK